MQKATPSMTTPGTTPGTETEPAADRGHGFRPDNERTRRIARRGGRVSAATRRGSSRRVVLPEDLPCPLDSPQDGVAATTTIAITDAWLEVLRPQLDHFRRQEEDLQRVRAAAHGREQLAERNDVEAEQRERREAAEAWLRARWSGVPLPATGTLEAARAAGLSTSMIESLTTRVQSRRYPVEGGMLTLGDYLARDFVPYVAPTIRPEPVPASA